MGHNDPYGDGSEDVGDGHNDPYDGDGDVDVDDDGDGDGDGQLTPCAVPGQNHHHLSTSFPCLHNDWLCMPMSNIDIQKHPILVPSYFPIFFIPI